MSINETVASPATVHIAGTDYKIVPLRCKDWGEINQHVRDKITALARMQSHSVYADYCKVAAGSATVAEKQMARDYMESERRLIWDAAYTKAASVNIMAGQGVEMLTGPEEMLHVVHIGLQRSHPDVSLVDLEQMIGDPNELADLFLQTMRISGALSTGGDSQHPKGQQAVAMVGAG